MDIKTASDHIRGTIEAYLLKDDAGLYQIPFEMQRPIILMGPPGVGKTAIVSQVAREMGINFVSYSITHHTRQSALGLPYIVEHTYGGRTYSVSEYTMSEIIGAVYDSIEASGVPEGVLFLDEVNCVSETLAPAMLQFLQYKRFGQHRLPAGWVIVTAGNPPEYNHAANEFDPAMLDRLKRIDVDPDLDVWQEYAAGAGVHPAVTTYLRSHPENFYDVHAGVRVTHLVTARGWEDLSRIIQAYERLGRKVGVDLVRQYLQDDAISEDFSLYYELFSKYRDDYKVPDILAGKAPAASVERAKAASFDERVAVVGLVSDAVGSEVRAYMNAEQALRVVRHDLVEAKPSLITSESPIDVLDQMIVKLREGGEDVNSPTGTRRQVEALRLEGLRELRRAVALADPAPHTMEAFEAARAAYNGLARDQIAKADPLVSHIDNALGFLDMAFGEGEEVLIMMTRLSADPSFVTFVSEHPSKAFTEHNKGLLLKERGVELLRDARALTALGEGEDD